MPDKKIDVIEYNRNAWDKNVSGGQNPWTLPVSPDDVAKARRGEFVITVSAGKPVPKHWFPDLNGCRVLCLASGGGQQGPILAAAGADVTVFDSSPKQLERDQMVAARENLTMHIVQGDMQDLSMFADGSFDIVINPVSLQFIPSPLSVWKEAARVLKEGGILISGYVNPTLFIFDFQDRYRGKLTVANHIPYSPFSAEAEKETAISLREGDALLYGHTLEDLIGGQLREGFVITGMYEDTSVGPTQRGLLDEYLPLFIVTRAVKAKI